MRTNKDFSVCFKCSEIDFNDLCEREGIIPAPYLARNKWVMVQKSAGLNKSEWEHFIAASYDLIKAGLSKKLQKELGLRAI
jgi:predicted DNA-binding protein (MmcQ/YjbR family)